VSVERFRISVGPSRCPRCRRQPSEDEHGAEPEVPRYAPPSRQLACASFDAGLFGSTSAEADHRRELPVEIREAFWSKSLNRPQRSRGVRQKPLDIDALTSRCNGVR
jgi:hypothetical protein